MSDRHSVSTNSDSQLHPIALDQLVFRELTKRTVTAVSAKPILDELNRKIPAKAKSIPPLWAEYIGLRRPKFRFEETDALSRLKALTARKEADQRLADFLGELIELYKKEPGIVSCELMRLTLIQFRDRTSHTVRAAENIARDILFFAGAGTSFKEIADSLATFYALDELLWWLRECPIDRPEVVGDAIVTLVGLTRHYEHVPITRITDSAMVHLEKVHRSRSTEESRKNVRVIVEARKGTTISSKDEAADCLWLWHAVQGVSIAGKLRPCTVLTFDGKATLRLKNMISILNLKIGSQSLLDVMRKNGALYPGEVILLDQSGRAKPQVLEVQKYLENN